MALAGAETPPSQPPPSGPVDSSYLAELQARAKASHLAEDPEWQHLVLYRKQRFGGVKSSVNFPEFFRAPHGDTDPAAELDATLAAFFSSTPIETEAPQCRYLARYEWLDEKLGFDAARLPRQACPRFGEWIRRLDPGQMYLVFASNDLKSPATMFGHTLLRIDAKQARPGERLLAYAVNYAAQTGENPGAGYAIKGLSGSYEGYYSVMPYYDKIKQYEQFDHRDLWEYPLQLTPTQEHRLLTHLWEMRGVGSAYYFLSDNCSSQLLALIEVARPDLDLTSTFHRGIPYAIPIDTVRQLRGSGLLGPPRYEPSDARRFTAMMQDLTPAQRHFVHRYINGRTDLKDPVYASADAVTRARLLDAVHEALFVRYADGEITREAGLPRDRVALLARAQLSEDADFTPVTAPAVSPDEGHDSGRFSIGGRVDPHDGAAVISARPAYHDRVDPPGGYLAGGELQFFNVRALIGPHGFRLSDLQLVSVQAVAPRNDAFTPISWQVALAARRYGVDRVSARSDLPLGGTLDGGPGLAWEPWSNVQVYTFAYAALDGNSRLHESYGLGAGTRDGVAVQWTSRLTQQAEVDWTGHVCGGALPLIRTTLASQYQLSPHNGLRLDFAYAQEPHHALGSLELTWQRYF